MSRSARPDELARPDDVDEALLPNAATALDAVGAPDEHSPVGFAAPDGAGPSEPPDAAGDPEASDAPPAEAAVEAPPDAGAAGPEPGAAAPRRRGRPKGSKNRPKPAPAPAAVEGPAPPAATPPAAAEGSARARRRGGPSGRPRPGARRAAARRGRLTIEQIVAVDSPREPRLSPDGRRVAYTAEAAGARQVFVMDVRSGQAHQLTASEQAVSDPQWSPDGARLAFVRDKSVWIVGVDGSRPTVVADHPAGQRAPRFAPDGRRLAFVSRRRGWDQVWVIEAPLPRRGPPPAAPPRREPRALTPVGIDVEDLAWSPDGTRLAILAQRAPDLTTIQVTVVDAATGQERVVAGSGAWETSPRWLPDGHGLLVASDRDGWFQVVRVPLDGGERTILTAGHVDHGDYANGFGLAPLPSPDGTRFVYPVIHDGLVDLYVAPLAEAGPVKRRRGRPPKHPPAEAAVIAGVKVNPIAGVWRAAGWMPDGSGILAVGATERDPEDLWLLPVPAVDGTTRRPRRLTSSLPAVVPVRSFVAPERVTITARDGLPVPLTVWRPAEATGRRGGRSVPTVVHAHGGPSAQVLLDFQPFRQLLVEEGFAFVSVDFRGSTGYGREYRLANRDEWGNADVHDVVDAARWAAAQPWSNGKLAMYGGSYGGYLTLCALVDEPGLWAAGVDLYGDSEIAESYRHGDRVGRIDLHRMMGSPDDPARAGTYRRGSPVYRAERIEAPLLLLHGRRDRRVVPLMTEKMVEALEIEGKLHEVHWYADEGHGWERRENRRDAFARIVDWLKRHLREDRPSVGP